MAADITDLLVVGAGPFGLAVYMGFTASCPFAGRAIVDAVMATSLHG